MSNPTPIHSELQAAVLFARRDSVYKSLPGCDVWDIDRDARKWPGGSPIVAHPPCRAWGRLRHFARPREGEKDLAVWAIDQIRKWGGVLEHPRASQLWPHLSLPVGRERDAWGGFSVAVPQLWWGHRAEKMTMLYVCGCNSRDLPPIPLSLDYARFVVSTSGRRRDGSRKPSVEIAKWEREATPEPFAKWLVDVARRSFRGKSHD